MCNERLLTTNFSPKKQGLVHYMRYVFETSNLTFCPVGWKCIIHWLLLCKGVRPSPNEFPGYDTKQSDGDVPVMLELWGMQSTLSLPSLPRPIWPGRLAPDRVLSMGQIQLNCVLMQNRIALNRTVFDIETVYLR